MHRILHKIRKYTLITAVIRGIAAVISLLEKSAVLLLFFSLILVLLPFALIPVTVCAVISIIGYFKMNGEVRRWITEADNVTVYITSERFFERGSFFCGVGWGAQEEHEGGGLLFARCAAFEAGEYTHPVIVVCGDPFLVARWAGLNLLLVKCDYFFILRRFYFNRKRVSYLVLS